jgi:hypothetical protein
MGSCEGRGEFEEISVAEWYTRGDERRRNGQRKALQRRGGRREECFGERNVFGERSVLERQVLWRASGMGRGVLCRRGVLGLGSI